MAVSVRLGAAGVPRRMAAASFPITHTAERATGNWHHRVTAYFGTVPVPSPGPPIVMAIPPGPTPGHSAATGGFIYPQMSIVRPALPRLLPWAGTIPHSVPGRTFTLAVAQPVQDTVVKPQYRKRTGAMLARVTNAPRPRLRWTVQGG